jgi:hypothetical protein
MNNRKFDSIIIGFLVFNLGRAAYSLLQNDILTALLCTLGWFFILYGWNGIKKTNNIKGNYKILLHFYLFVVIIMIIRGYMIDYPYIWVSAHGMINCHFFDTSYILPYIMPLLLLIPLGKVSFRKLIKWMIPFVIFGSFLNIYFFNDIVAESTLTAMGDVPEVQHYGFSTAFVTPFVFFLLCNKYISKNQLTLLLIATFLLAVVSAIAGRRGDTLIIVTYIAVALLMLYKEAGNVTKFFLIFAYGLIIILLVQFVFNSGLFSFIFERGLEDTRSEAEESMLSQMNTFQKIFGMGLNGRYYYPIRSFQDDYLNGWRYGIETGFFNLVLKGGYLMAILYVILLLIPSYYGIFKSNNQLCKAFGSFIFISVLELYPFGWLSFNIKFLIIWIGISMCMNPAYRKMDDNQIKNQIFR